MDESFISTILLRRVSWGKSPPYGLNYVNLIQYGNIITWISRILWSLNFPCNKNFIAWGKEDEQENSYGKMNNTFFGINNNYVFKDKSDSIKFL
jgi:hypothetical protein